MALSPRRAAIIGATAVIVACAAVLSLPSTVSPVHGQLSAAGDTGAVLSFIDAAAGHVEVVRHWPQSPADVDVYPFVPYFWDGCPGPGAIMMLLTASPIASDAAAAGGTSQIARINDLSARVAGAVRAAFTVSSAQPSGAEELRRLAAALRTPGDPIAESAKAVLPLVADLGAYERRGYAVFAFVAWQGWRCGVTLRAVPEGYGIPFVR